MFQDHQVEKQYRVKVHGDFSSVLPKGENVKTISQALSDGNVMRRAVSHVRFISFDLLQDESVLDINIETGRKHQIRRHLSGLGFPVVGDRLYGGHDNDTFSRDMQLSAISLTFVCPVSGENKNFVLF